MTAKPKSPDKVTLKIPGPLYRKISGLIEGTGYNSVTDFVVFVLRDLVGSAGAKSAAPANEPDVEKTKEKLRRLGYM